MGISCTLATPDVLDPLGEGPKIAMSVLQKCSTNGLNSEKIGPGSNGQNVPSAGVYSVTNVTTDLGSW